ncbi:MAG: leucyl aminopeptidase, partial [Gemmatimonadetes bacterium]|nr:leucyl aminopeptidase [Gemmatimonadota bacterium]
HAVREAESLGVSRLTISPGLLESEIAEEAFQAIVEGMVLANWEFCEMKTDSKKNKDRLLRTIEVLSEEVATTQVEKGIKVGRIIGEAANFARTLQTRPGNVATPTHLGDEASRIASEYGLKVTGMDPIEIEKNDMQALLAVSRGSSEEPRFIILEHEGGSPDESPLVLVGKGLTFDAGGISIKPSSGMEDMIFDMSGGAAVIATLQAVAALGLNKNVIGLIPCSENLINGRAMKPGDIIGSREGKTIEVINTDAEGRLILADALSYAQGFGPSAIVDCATLTGAVVIALGHHAAAVLGNDEDLVRELRVAGDRSGERCWPLPLWNEYRQQIESEVADLSNIGGRPAGTITAACFLKEFVGDCKWAHLDVAGTAYGEGKLSYQKKGALGFPTRLLIEWVRSRKE